MPEIVAEHGVPIAGVVAFEIAEASGGQQAAQCRKFILVNDYVEVLVGTSLAAEEGIDRPATVDPDRDVRVIEEPAELSRIVGGHFIDHHGN